MINFLCRFDGQTNADLHLSLLGQCNMCRLVVATLERHLSSALVVGHASVAIRRLAIDEDNQASFGASPGCCGFLSDALREHIDNPAVTKQVCAAIYNLCANNAKHQNADISRQQFGKAGCCGLLSIALSKHIDNPAVTEQVCAAICNISLFSNNRTKMRRKMEVTKNLKEILSRYSNNKSLKANASSALQVLEAIKPPS